MPIFVGMRLARILLACTMLVATIFKTLPDSVFDYFHHHEHAYNCIGDEPSVGNYKHLCHVEDWNFEALEATDYPIHYVQNISLTQLVSLPFELATVDTHNGIGRAPPVA